MSKKLGIISLVGTLTSLLVAIAAVIVAVISIQRVENTNEDIQYVLYLGTNDKDTNTIVFDKEKCKEEAEKILIDHFGGYTIEEANGGWVDGETLYQEYTLVIYISDSTLEKVHQACKDLISTFNQSSILIQSNKTVTEFYSG